MDVVQGVLLVVAGLVVLATALSLVPGPFAWARSFDFPRLQIAALGLVVLGGVLLAEIPDGLPARVLLGLLAASVLYQAARMLPYSPLWRVQSVRFEGTPDDGATLRLVVSNVTMTNRAVDQWAREIEGADPDVVAAVETDAWWTDHIGERLAAYEHRVEVPQDNTYGMAVYSRFPLEDMEVRHLVEDTVPSIWARVVLPSGARVQLVVVHPRPPRPDTGQGSEFRDAELALVARDLEKVKRPAVVVGDLNDVAWSRTTTRFLKLARVLDPRIGRGLYPTFPARWSPLRYPLDHVFHSDDLALVELKRLGRVGSDHLPMGITLALAPAADQAPPARDGEDVEEAAEAVADAHQTLREETPAETAERDQKDR